MRACGLTFVALGAVIGGCAHSSVGVESAFGEHGTVRPELALDSAPWLRERILTNPYTYFRFVNGPFVAEVCRRLGPLAETAQRVNLHGDAHLEQFAITDTGRGLNDFDDSAKGPAAVDLVRFVTSLRLAGAARQWSVEPAIDRLFAGYRAALADPQLRVDEPALVTARRAQFQHDPALYFAAIEKVMEPLAPADETGLRAAFEPYRVSLQHADPAAPPTFFDVKKLGRTRVGIGSARALKYLVRIEGATSSPDDDEVLEIKEVGEVPAGTCVERAPRRDPMRPIVGQARLAYEPYRFTGYVMLGAMPFWVHAWARNYCELSAADFPDVGALGDVAYDAGVQLGLGHPRYIAAPFEAETRARELEALVQVEPVVRKLADELAREITVSWERARATTR